MTSVDEYVPGDPSAVRSVATSVSELGADFGDAAGELRSVAGNRSCSDWFGAAATQFDLAIDDLPSDLALMAEAHADVGEALTAYAATLTELRRRAAEAVERLKLARREREAAGQRADAARARIRQLTGQLTVANAAVGTTWSAVQLARATPMQPGAATAQQAYTNARRRAHDVSNALDGERRSERSHANAEANAQREAERLEGLLEGYRDDRRSAERRCADSIRDALPKELKNPSAYEKAKRWVGDQVQKFVDLAEAAVDVLSSGSFTEFVANVRKLAKALSECLDAITIALMVAGAALTVAALFTGGATLPFAAMCFKGALVLQKVNKVADGVALVTGIGLAASGAKIDGRRVVTGQEAFGDTVAYGASFALGKATKRIPGPLFKDHLKIGARSAGNFSSYVNGRFGSSMNEQLAKRLFLKDFTKTVMLPHVGWGTAGFVAKQEIRRPIDDLLASVTSPSPMDGRLPDVDDVVGDALADQKADR